MRTTRIVQLSPVRICLENKENEKRNTDITVGNTSNCFTIHKVLFFMSPREISYVSKLE